MTDLPALVAEFQATAYQNMLCDICMWIQTKFHGPNDKLITPDVLEYAKKFNNASVSRILEGKELYSDDVLALAKQMKQVMDQMRYDAINKHFGN